MIRAAEGGANHFPLANPRPHDTVRGKKSIHSACKMVAQEHYEKRPKEYLSQGKAFEKTDKTAYSDTSAIKDTDEGKAFQGVKSRMGSKKSQGKREIKKDMPPTAWIYVPYFEKLRKNLYSAIGS
ncbi:hypothetical protein MASR2M70_19840 [Bacillota bacterium]